MTRKALQRLLPILIVILIIIAYHWYFYDFPYTRDAYISAGVSTVSADRSGYIKKIFIQNNQMVHAGQVLFSLDSSLLKKKIQLLETELAQTHTQTTDPKIITPFIAQLKLQLLTYHEQLKQSLVKAKIGGLISNFHLQVGTYITKDKPLFALINPKSWSCVARFRETLLAELKPGDPVTVKIDMYPNLRLPGIIKSIGWGINRRQNSLDAAPSALPYLKATEDWIRIPQRFPVHIQLLKIDPHYPLRLGANASVYVKTRA